MEVQGSSVSLLGSIAPFIAVSLQEGASWFIFLPFEPVFTRMLHTSLNMLILAWQPRLIYGQHLPLSS